MQGLLCELEEREPWILTVHAFRRTVGRRPLFLSLVWPYDHPHPTAACYLGRCLCSTQMIKNTIDCDGSQVTLETRRFSESTGSGSDADLDLVSRYYYTGRPPHTQSCLSHPGRVLTLGNMVQANETHVTDYLPRYRPYAGRQTPFKPQRVINPPTPTPTPPGGMVPRPWFDQVAGLINNLPAPSTLHAPPDCAEWSTACLFHARDAQSAPPPRFPLPLGIFGSLSYLGMTQIF